MDFELYGVAGAVLIALLMEGVKKAFPELHGLPAWRVMIGLGVLVSICAHIANIMPSFNTWLMVALRGLVAALAAGGLYAGVKDRE